MMKKFRLVGLAVVVLAILALLLYRNFGVAESSEIAFSGNLELTQVDIAFKIPGRILSLETDEGRTVEVGDVLARLDPEQVESQRRQAESKVQALQAREAELLAAIDFQQANRDALLRQRTAELEQAEALLRELQSGARRQEVEEVRAAYQRAKVNQRKAELDWDRARELYRNEDISTAQYEQFQAGFEGAEAALQQAAQRLSLVEEGSRRERIEAAQAAVNRTRGGIQQVEAMDLDIRRTEASIVTLKAEVESARAAVAVLDSQVRDHEVAATIPGVVLKKSAEPGEVVAAGSRILTLGDLDRPWVRGYIPEQLLGHVRLDDRVRIRTDSFPGKDYWGRVSFIASEAEFTPKQIETREERVKLVYRIKVDVENPNQELKLNMPVDAVIIGSREQ